MRNPTQIRPVSASLLVSALLVVGGHAIAAGAPADDAATMIAKGQDYYEPWNSGWSVRFDNDILARQTEDRDYTAGFAVTLHGLRAKETAVSLDPALAWLNRKVPFPGLSQSAGFAERKHAMEFGLVLFTPDDIETEAPIHDDRPYASLVYLSNTQYALHPNRRTAYQSTLTIGALGSPLGESLHRGVHEATNGTEPLGYDNQISDGGELTARYAVARHALLASRFDDLRTYDVSASIEGSVGYLTEASVGLSMRWGRIATPWWSATSQFAGYATQPAVAPRQSLASLHSRERYFWASMRVRARAYNAFLQGQFRDSAVTFSSSELNNVLGEVAVGLTTEFANLRMTYSLGIQSKEITSGVGARSMVWGGVTISRYFDE